MGRITLFTLADCPHCKRTKDGFTSRKVPFTEICLTSHPQTRTDMLALSNALSVPQVFFNDEHVGGADETLDILNHWDKLAAHGSMSTLERYEKEVASVEDAPRDCRLAPPTSPPEEEPTPPPRDDREKFIEWPHRKGQTTSAADITKDLLTFMPKRDLSYRNTVYKNAFTGTDGVTALQRHFNLETRDDAVYFGRQLQLKKVLHHVTNDDHNFEDTNNYYFRLQPYHTPNILNSFIIWHERVDPDAMALILRLKQALAKVELAATNSNGLMDYVAAKSDPNFVHFEEAACELQGVNFGSLMEDEKLAFGINLYNLMIKFAFIKVGIPQKTLHRSAFFNHVGYNVGGYTYTLSEWENGILRGNAVAPYQIKVPFPPGDPRLKFVIRSPDCRIHFALNCGARSCPPVKTFTAATIDEELRIVAQAFCEQPEYVSANEMNNELSVSMILSWYQADFVSKTSDLPQKLLSFMRLGRARVCVERLIRDRRPVKVTFKEYDWSTTATRSLPFEGASCVTPNESQLRSFFSGLKIM